MNIQSILGATCAAFAFSSSAAMAIDVLHIANADSPDYRAFIEGRPENTDEDLENNFTFTHVGNGTGAGVVGGLLSRTTTFAGLNGGEKTVKQYLESFDLVIIGNGINSANFTDTSGWSALGKPLLVHSALVARASSNGTTTDRVGLFTGGQSSFTYGNPADTLPATPSSTLRTAIFEGVTTPTDLYSSDFFASAEANLSAAMFGGGELISSLVTTAAPATPGAHGVVFWEAGSNNGAGLVQAAKRGYMVLRNGNDSSTTLTTDGKQVLGNLIDQLLVESEVIFLPPTNLVAKSAADLKINLTWTASDGAVSYKIKRSLTPGGPYTELITTPATVTTTNYQDSGLTEGNTYYYVVSAVNAAATQSADSVPASAPAVTTLLAGIDILYVATGNNAEYQNLLTNGQFANNTWTHKVPGIAGNNTVGGSLNRGAEFSGINGTDPGMPIPVSDYLNKFKLVILGVPTGSLNFADAADGGALWANLTVPILVHSPFVARALDGRLGLFSGDNTVNPAVFVNATESVRTSVSPLSDAILAGVTDVTNLYASAQVDTINTAVRSPNDLGQGEEITRITATAGVNPTPVQVRGVVFWATGATLPVSPPVGLQVASNRAFLPLSGGPVDLNADGRLVLTNLIQQLQVDQNVTFPPLLTYPAGVAAEEAAGDVYVSWEEAINAVSYNVKRATTVGGPYTQIATNVTDLYYTDTAVDPGATYYYVVSAVSSTPAESPNSDEVTVTLAGGDNYEAWIQTYLVQLPNAADRLPGADPDSDGSTNLIEFALNGNPANPADNGAIASLIEGSSLKLVVAVRDGAAFAGGPTATVSGITYTVEGSLGLSFPDSAVSSTGPTDTAPPAAALPDLTATAWEYHTFTLDASAGLTGKGFLRLKVTQP